MKVAIISLGCPRNLVDSEVILGELKKEGFSVCDIDDTPDICVINTCSFIQSSREESVDAIIEAAALKKEKRIGHLVVCGCLPQMYKDKLLKEVPEIDIILGTSDFSKIKDYVNSRSFAKRRAVIGAKTDYLYDEHSPRELLTPSHYAYVKISEGCDNFCSYCNIPRLRGAHRSRDINSVVKEVERLLRPGRIKEIDIIGQDTTMFGRDTCQEGRLGELLRKVTGVKGSPRWIRLLYTHPAHYTEDFIAAVRDEEKVCKYLDIPIQHISDTVLKKMNRHTTKKGIIGLIDRLRNDIPLLAIRTSLITGFPGETDKDFKELFDFVREIRFERLGVFAYSKENGTPAAKLKGQLPEKVKRDRVDVLMRAQAGISLDINRSFIGRTVDVLIDEKQKGDEGVSIGRTAHDAPEIDNAVQVTGKDVRVGDFCRVKITAATEYDLIGEAL
ncbi:MAG: 30S ribosomal protein S12 methylthiotransferase RimO [Candidatus Omnitrophota bacterium]